jgi:hypothetical protein
LVRSEAIAPLSDRADRDAETARRKDGRMKVELLAHPGFNR